MAMVDNATMYQHFNRKLLPSHIQTLETEWVRKLSVPVPRMAFGYMAARAAEIERELDGRLAASIGCHFLDGRRDRGNDGQHQSHFR